MASRSENLKKLQNLNAAASLIANKQTISNNQTVKNGANIPSFDYIASATNKKGDTYGYRARQQPDNIASSVARGALTGVQGAINKAQTDANIVGAVGSTLTPISELLKNYTWGNGSQYLTPDNPLTQDVVYNNEFSPETTAQMSDAIYNQYYAPLVAQQQKLTTQAYRDAAQTATAQAGAAGMATGSRGAVQAMSQANRDAQNANLTYQLQQQVQAFQDTINARKIELENKTEDYKNAWEEVAKYGYVVSDKTGQLLGIQPGQQLTSLAYKETMSNIAKAVAEIEADKVRLAQSQQQIEISDRNNRETESASIYNRLIDMLSRYDTVTPEMVSLGKQVGMNMTVGDYTTNYMSEAEINASKNNQTSFTDKRTLQQIATEILPTISKMGGVTNSSTFAKYIAQEMANGTTAYQVQQNIRSMRKEDLEENGIGTTNASKQAAINIINQVMGAQGNITQNIMSDTTANTAERQLTGRGWLNGSYLDKINAYFKHTVSGGNRADKAGGTGTITVTGTDGTSKTYTLPKTVTGFNNIRGNLNIFSTGYLGAGGDEAEQYIRENFYDANGNLKSNVKLSNYNPGGWSFNVDWINYPISSTARSIGELFW